MFVPENILWSVFPLLPLLAKVVVDLHGVFRKYRGTHLNVFMSRMARVEGARHVVQIFKVIGTEVPNSLSVTSLGTETRRSWFYLVL